MSEATAPVDPRFPIGKHIAPQVITPELRTQATLAIAEMPLLLRSAIEGLTEEQLNTPYREGGWTVLQLVHHLADSHSTGLHRLKRALTEEWPAVENYDEEKFAELQDATAPADWSLDLIECVHAHWVMLLQVMTEEKWARGYKHSALGQFSLDKMTQMYAWHCKHHVAHITHLREQNGW